MSVFEKHAIQKSHIPFIFHSFDFKERKSVDVGNWHENIELLYFTKGSATVTSDELCFNAAAGEIAVINANRIHTTRSDVPLHFYCLIIDRAFCLSNHLDTNLISFKSKIHDAEIAALIEEIAREHASDSPYRVQMMRAAVLKILSLLCRRHSEGDNKPYSGPPHLSAVKRAIGYISSHYADRLTLDMLAEASGLSKYYLAREFHKVTGCTPVTYINVFRTEMAKRMLSESEESIESIARACGFGNFSYFSKVFLKTVGVRPSEYRAALKSAAPSQTL